MLNLISDNASPVAPQLLDALTEANSGYASSYATDRWSRELDDVVSRVMDHEAAVVVTATGTAANALSLATLCPPWKRVLCHRFSHIMESEAGAAEAMSGGGKLAAPSRPSDRLDALDVRKECEKYVSGDPHSHRTGLVSVTQATESGTVYSRDQLGEIGKVVRTFGLKFHMDGARFANAIVALDCSPAEMTWKAGLDALSFGVAKNGGALGDMVVMFDRNKAEELRYRQMRSGHLMSKQRYAASQILAYFRDDLWLAHARNANDSANALGRQLVDRGFGLAAPVQVNQVFAIVPGRVVDRLIAGGFSIKTASPERFPDAGLEDGNRIVRFVTNWSTTPQEISGAAGMLENLRS